MHVHEDAGRALRRGPPRADAERRLRLRLLGAGIQVRERDGRGPRRSGARGTDVAPHRLPVRVALHGAGPLLDSTAMAISPSSARQAERSLTVDEALDRIPPRARAPPPPPRPGRGRPGGRCPPPAPPPLPAPGRGRVPRGGAGPWRARR